MKRPPRAHEVSAMASDYEEMDAGRRTTAARRIASLVSICLLGASTAAADQADDAYVAIDLTPAGFVESQAAGASSGSQVGFGFGAATFGAEHALLWAGSPASAVDLHPAGYVMSNALGASGIRQVGWASAADTGVPHAFLWSGSAASGVDLHPPDFTYSRARGTFGDVQVGSGAGPATGFSDHALLWTGTATSVIDLNGAWVLFVGSAGRFREPAGRGR